MVNRDVKGKREYTIEDLENLLDSLPYIIWIKDEEGRYKYTNKLASEKLDLDKKALRNLPDNEIKILEKKMGTYSKGKVKIAEKNIHLETYTIPFFSSKKTNLIGGVVSEIIPEKNINSNIENVPINICSRNKHDKLKNKERLKQIISDFKKILDVQGMSVYIYNSEKEVFENYVKSGVLNNFNEVISKDSINNTELDKFYCIRCGYELIGVLDVQYSEKYIVNKNNNEDIIKSICDVNL